MNTQALGFMAIGAAIGGGFFAGQVMIDGAAFGLIVAPKEAGERESEWLSSCERVAGADSYCDGLQNTIAMAAAGSELAQWARDLRIGDHDDWYIPSQDELEIIYRGLKPTARDNSRYARSGINISAIPPTAPYTATVPAQTAVQGFVEGGADAFADDWYWSSTQHAGYADYAWIQVFGHGGQSNDGKSASLRARAVRRFAI